MKFSILTITAALASFEYSSAFAPLNNSNRNNAVVVNMAQPGMDLSGNSWQPDSEKMGVSTVDNYIFYYYYWCPLGLLHIRAFVYGHSSPSYRNYQ